MPNSPSVSSRNTSPEVTASGVDTAVIPLGSVEGKGPHLPVAADFLLADAFAAQYAEEAGGVYLLPALPYGCSDSQRGFRGTVYLDTETMWHVLADIVESLRHGGFARFTVLNLCSTNWVVKPTVRELNLRLGRGPVVWVEPKQFAYDIYHSAHEGPDDRHAGAVDTALMMHCRPDCVGDLPPDSCPAVGREFVDYVGLRAVSATGVWGSPRRATPALGRELFSHMLAATRSYIASAYATWSAEEGT
ncbi:hypothetical protein CMK11_17270 [Candidatus Poribacteria bacterium]|nr:hypothetical protein [Candidatus Poribacteria bacterium]